MSGRLSLCPVTFSEAAIFVTAHHSHLGAPLSHKFSIGAAFENEIVGVVIVGRPVSRVLDDGLTLEITRCCTDGLHFNACSMLYGAARRASWALGYRRLITYTLGSERGTALIAAGYRVVAQVRGNRSWSTPSRPRVDVEPNQRKLRWEAE